MIVYAFRPVSDSMSLERSHIDGISTARQIRVDLQLCVLTRDEIGRTIDYCIIDFVWQLRELVKPETKKWKWEKGDEKMGIFLHNCIACPLCIQQHLLERTSATGDSGEEVEHMLQLNTQKVL